MNRPPLSIELYNAQEKDSLLNLSNDHIRAFSPVSFKHVCYPTNITDQREILRYVDTMHEMDAPKRHHEETLYSPEEASLVQYIGDSVAEITKSQFGRTVRPWMGPLAGIRVFRCIQAIAKAAGIPRLRILEIGPGSGYLGSLLIASGHIYSSMDCTQVFHLWQNLLFRKISKGDFCEGAEFSSWPYPAESRVTHIPWWHYAAMHRGQIPTFDIVLCEHALGEIYSLGLRYIIHLSNLMLRESPIGTFLFSHFGWQFQNTQETVFHTFRLFEYEKVAEKNLWGYSPRGKKPPSLSVLMGEVPAFNPSGDPQRLKGYEFVPIRDEEAPYGFDFFEFIKEPGPRRTSTFT